MGSVSVSRLSLTDSQVQAPDQELPSTKMYCDVAPAARMAFMAAWLRSRTVVWSSVLNSLSGVLANAAGERGGSY
jgi:hypothetical protein